MIKFYPPAKANCSDSLQANRGLHRIPALSETHESAPNTLVLQRIKQMITAGDISGAKEVLRKYVAQM